MKTLEVMADGIEREEEVRVPKVGAWVFVKLTNKSITKYFVGQILELNKENDDYVVKFLRRSGTAFQWLEKEDLSVVTQDDIVVFIPELMLTRRWDKVIFKVKFDGYNVSVLRIIYVQ